MGEPRLGEMETIVGAVASHTRTNIDLITLVQADPQSAHLLFDTLPERLRDGVEDLRTVATQLQKLRELATRRNYADVLAILDEKKPYDRAY